MKKNLEMYQDDDLDISDCETLDDQKLVSLELLDSLIDCDQHMKLRITNIETLNDFVRADTEIASNVGEFVGYHYGRIEEANRNTKQSIGNLDLFSGGEFDSLSHEARGMAITMWYQMGSSSFECIDSALDDLESLERNLIRNSDISMSELVELRGVLH